MSNDLDTACEYFYTTIESIFEKFVPKRVVSNNQSDVNNNKNYLIDKELNLLRRQKRKAHYEYKTSQCDVDKANKKAEFNKLRALCKKKIRHNDSQYVNRVENSIKSDVNTFRKIC